VKPPAERSAPAVQVRVQPREDQEDEGDAFSAFDEIAGEKTQIDSGSLQPALAAPPPPRVGGAAPAAAPARPGEANAAAAPPRAPRVAPPFAPPEVSLPGQVVDMGAVETTEPLNGGGGHRTDRGRRHAGAWVEDRAARRIGGARPVRRLLSERDTHPPPRPTSRPRSRRSRRS
jgi:hypothetical protein